MKLISKSIFIFSILLFLGISFGYASNQSFDDIDGKYGVYFCNNEDQPTKSLQLSTTVGTKNEICLFFINDSEYDIKIDVGVVDGKQIGEQGGQKILDCNYINNPGVIGKYIEKDWTSPVNIPANSKIRKILNVTFPIGVEGQIETCMVAKLNNILKKGGNMFSFDFRNISYLDFFVIGDFSGSNIIKIGKTNTYLDNIGKLIIDGTIDSKAPLNNLINIDGTITNIFGYKQIFSIKDISLKAGSSINFSTKDLNINSFLPRYKGLYSINLDIRYKPFFEFDTSNLNIDENILEKKQIKISTNYFEMPRIIIGITILIILLIFLAFRKSKQKVVYVQQPQQPTPTIQ